ncbi:MAG: hypothetical protein HWN66_20245, partial [Candidatus Helarchaeota archaeon]|nr:hypothetical protein [Candidatus Helarchaeota archaeon]
MFGNLSDEKTNELIQFFAKSVRKNLISRSALETPLFPVSHYIHTATYVIYDQAYLYNIMKEVAKVLPPEEFARRNKTVSTIMHHLGFYSIAMLYLHGRAQVIYDNLQRRKRGESIEVEPEEKKKETKFILDYWRRLSPNYKNDGKLSVEDGTLRFLSPDFVNTLQQEMVSVHDNLELVRQIKRTSALLTSRTFLAHAECRAGVFEHGPYETESPDEVLLFKDFIGLYTGDLPYGLNDTTAVTEKMMPLISHLLTKATAPVDNIVFGMTLKNMQKLTFNDFGTLFAEPSDYTKNITSVGLWTRESMHPKNMRYPDHLGEIKKLPFDILKPLQIYSQESINEMYIDIATWDFLKRLLTGVTLYANAIAAISTLYAGIEDK